MGPENCPQGIVGCAGVHHGTFNGPVDGLGGALFITLALVVANGGHRRWVQGSKTVCWHVTYAENVSVTAKLGQHKAAFGPLWHAMSGGRQGFFIASAPAWVYSRALGLLIYGETWLRSHHTRNIHASKKKKTTKYLISRAGAQHFVTSACLNTFPLHPMCLLFTPPPPPPPMRTTIQAQWDHRS